MTLHICRSATHVAVLLAAFVAVSCGSAATPAAAPGSNPGAAPESAPAKPTQPIDPCSVNTSQLAAAFGWRLGGPEGSQSLPDVGGTTCGWADMADDQRVVSVIYGAQPYTTTIRLVPEGSEVVELPRSGGIGRQGSESGFGTYVASHCDLPDGSWWEVGGTDFGKRPDLPQMAAGVDATLASLCQGQRPFLEG